MLFGKLKNQITFFQELSSLIGSGISLIDALQFLQIQTNIPVDIKKELVFVLADVRNGTSLGEALQRHNIALEEWQLGLIKGVEKSGKLKEGLNIMVGRLEKRQEIYRSAFIKSIYPLGYMLILIFAYPLGALIRMIACWCPTNIWLYVFSVAKIFFMATCFFGIFIYFPLKVKSRKWKQILHKIILPVPLIGSSIKRMSLYQFMSMFSVFYSAGLNIITAWSLAVESCGNQHIAQRLEKGSQALREGGDIDLAFYMTKLFPNEIIGFIRTGAKCGTLKDQLDKCTIFYEKEYAAGISTLLGVFPKVFFLIIAFLIIRLAFHFQGAYFDWLLGGGVDLDQQTTLENFLKQLFIVQPRFLNAVGF